MSRPICSRPQRLAAGTPTLLEVFNDLARLLVADLYQLIVEVAVLPLREHRRKPPAEVLPEPLIGWAVIVLKPPDEPPGVIDRPALADDRVVSDLVGHLEPFFL